MSRLGGKVGGEVKDVEASIEGRDNSHKIKLCRMPTRADVIFFVHRYTLHKD